MTDIQLRILLASLNESDETFENVIGIVDDESVGLNDGRVSTGKRKSADMDSDYSET